MLCACLAAVSAFRAGALTVKHSHRRPKIAAKLPVEVERAVESFSAYHDPKLIDALWVAVRKCYGSEEAAVTAVRRNGQILCPTFASPKLISDSYGGLSDLMGTEEALEIMMKNPAVLTCGDRIRTANPAEIRNFANFRRRSMQSRQRPLAAVLTVVGLILYKIVMTKLQFG